MPSDLPGNWRIEDGLGSCVLDAMIVPHTLFIEQEMLWEASTF